MYVPPGQAGQPPRKGLNGCVIALIVCLGLILVGGLMAMLFGALLPSRMSGGERGFGVGGDRVGLITISGIISSGDESISLFGASAPGEIALSKQLRDAAKEESVKAVLLRVDSPGGAAAASQAIYKEVLRLREKKPVVVSMGDVAASGGYYISSAADWIVASPATMTGSIGVITETINYEGLAKRFGVQDQTFTSGPYKDTMNPMRPMRPDERTLLKAMIDDVYQQFVADVAKGRKMKPEAVRKLADGRAYTGSQAKKVGLVDELGNFRDALDIAAKRGKIQGEPKIRKFGYSTSPFGWLSETPDGDALASLARLAQQAPRPLSPGLWMLMQVDQQVVAR
jgi:protease-4